MTKFKSIIVLSSVLLILFGSCKNNKTANSDSNSLEEQIHQYEILDSIINRGELVHKEYYEIGSIGESMYFGERTGIDIFVCTYKTSNYKTDFIKIDGSKSDGRNGSEILFFEEVKSLVSAIDKLNSIMKKTSDHNEIYEYTTKYGHLTLIAKGEIESDYAKAFRQIILEGMSVEDSDGSKNKFIWNTYIKIGNYTHYLDQEDFMKLKELLLKCEEKHKELSKKK